MTVQKVDREKVNRGARKIKQGQEGWLRAQWYNTCLPCTRLWVWVLEPYKNKPITQENKNKQDQETEGAGWVCRCRDSYFLRSLSFFMPIPDARKDWFWSISEATFFLEKAIISASKILLFSSSLILSSWWTLLRCSNLACSCDTKVKFQLLAPGDSTHTQEYALVSNNQSQIASSNSSQAQQPWQLNFIEVSCKNYLN